jgi:4-amino-4-deoxy-L-arabinose transferase-like glycosyltransferase
MPPALLFAATAWLLFLLCCRRLGLPSGLSLLACLLYAFCTMALVYSKTNYSDPP